jgi:putative FmdB family regulatory protein
MPIYEYQCVHCKQTTEVMQRSGDPSPLCKHCTSNDPLVKKITAANFRLKGHGWSSRGSTGS